VKQQDYYEILGVSRDATFEEIVEAYREMIQRFHPDLHPAPPGVRIPSDQGILRYLILSAEFLAASYSQNSTSLGIICSYVRR